MHSLDRLDGRGRRRRLVGRRARLRLEVVRVELRGAVAEQLGVALLRRRPLLPGGRLREGLGLGGLG